MLQRPKSVKTLKNEVNDRHDDDRPADATGDAAPPTADSAPQPTDATEHQQA